MQHNIPRNFNAVFCTLHPAKTCHISTDKPYCIIKNKAFFLDRDGTLNVDHDFVHKPEEWDWIEGVPETLKLLHNSGYTLIVVTNQSGIARGHFSLEQVESLHRWVNADLEKMGFQIDAFYIAPWHPDFHAGKDPGLLGERKPGTRLFLDAAEKFDIDFSRSFMAGDKKSDVLPAIELGMTPILIHSRFTTDELISWAESRQIKHHKTLTEAVKNSTYDIS